MIYEMNHIWTAEMKWNEGMIVAVKRNLSNCVKKPEKNSGLQRGLNPWPHDTGAMLYQLSYEATDVGSRSIVGSYVPVKEMSVNDIWNESYMNCGNEMKWRYDRRSETQFKQLRKEAWKKEYVSCLSWLVWVTCILIIGGGRGSSRKYCGIK